MKVQEKQVKAQIKKAKIIYPDNRNIFFHITLGLSFLITFIFYVLTLAPSVSFEDSGELITAAYFLGVPHEPGYPLFTMLGKIFTLIIPFGNIAYRVNLMSAFFSSLSCMFVAYSTILIIEDSYNNYKFFKLSNYQITRYLIGLGCGLFFGFAVETWKQAVMAEVYGINSCLVALFILLVLIWRRQDTIEGRKKYLYIISFVIALAVTAHMTSLMLIPVLFVFILVTDYKLLLSVKTILKSILFFILGLAPFLYLPLASLGNPPMNWGKPDNITNFIRVVSRHQFQNNEPQTAERFSCQFKFYLNQLLPEQWFPLFLILALAGLYLLYRQNKKYFWFVIMFLLFSIPVLTYIVNADISCTADITDITGGMVSVFYVPSYIMLSILIGIGFFYLISSFKFQASSFMFQIFGILFVLMASSNVSKNYKDADKSDYYYPEKYFNNVSKAATKNAIIMGDWDPYVFPFFYYQFVEKKRTDLISIDINLLKRSWYIEWLKNYYPAIIKNSQPDVDNFLNAVAPFEKSELFDGNFIQVCYENMIHSLIEKNMSKGTDVYITYINYQSQKILAKYKMEPVYAAFKIQRDTSITKVEYSDFDLNDFTNKNNSTDGILIKFKEYYGSLVLSRANMFDKMKNSKEALKNYKLALPFYNQDANALDYIHQKIKQLN